ncbi:hypothetical protein [Methylorubrum thiocyanatum]|uniref:Uncharacterized protein n=1 Tax=Methylorubrum thiocyanatum TaxID=47958 RepID=A0AA40S7B8_9HYPH|nr:hypothetical protein [Methylorubrum thiocyanatum]MBA8915790.1 hypothetical protein [Methylorubrum thiocyanatum]GJE81237.1 hypothetical protein CJNNKLLH_2585 [Methylorubrum thiocyanatum]
MTTTNAPVTIAGIALGAPNSYVAQIDTANEAELVACLRKLPAEDFIAGMQALTNYLHTLDQGMVVDRYVTVLVEMAGGQAGEDAVSI